MSRLLSTLPRADPVSAPVVGRSGISRRRFLGHAAGTLAAVAVAGTGAGWMEARRCRVLAVDAPVPRLPAAFEGLRVAFLADTHHSANVPLPYLEGVVAMTNALRPDLVLLGGDYVWRRWDDDHPSSLPYVRPGLGALGRLRAPLGVWAVLGNHDTWGIHVKQIRAALAENGIPELRNRGTWLERGGARLRLAGTEDLWTGRPDVHAALGDARETDAVLLLQHNPDYAEELNDPRVGLMLCGHTHGGQIVVPGLGWAPRVPSRFGQKYLHGFRRGPAGTQVFVTRGVGTIGPPLRLGCPPEVALLTLRTALRAE